MLRDLTSGNGIRIDFAKWVSKLAWKVLNNNGEKEGGYQLSRQQMQVLRSLHDNKYNIIKGYRCAGMSTMLRLNTLFKMLYMSGMEEYHALFILDRKNSAICEKDQFIKLLQACDEYIVMTKNDCDKVELLFDGKKIIVEFISQYDLIKRRGKQEKLDLINVDNAAWIVDKLNSDSIALMASLSHADVNMASTPNGEKGLFYETWSESINGHAPFKMSSLKWYLDDRFNKGLRGSDGLQSYSIDNIGMLFEAFERNDMITSDWYEEKKTMLGSNVSREIDCEFV